MKQKSKTVSSVKTGGSKNDLLSSGTRTHVAKFQFSSKGTQKKIFSEKQGPIDWSCYGLKSKYRGEAEREDAWRFWQRQYASSVQLLKDSNLVVPVVTVERHPFYSLFHKRLEEENRLSSSRTKSRLLMKRFVFDVQELWLTNIQHLREHMHDSLFDTEDKSGSSDENRANFNRGNGLKDRRDVKAIESMDSQIQSVSQKRVFANAFHTARLPGVKVVLDYIPEATPTLSGVKPLPPVIEPLLSVIHMHAHHIKGAFADLPEFNASEIVLHVDRLIPSQDYELGILQPDVLWRFSVYYANEFACRYFLSLESSITSYVASRLLKKAEASCNETNLSPSEYGSVVVFTSIVYASEESVAIRWAGNAEKESSAKFIVTILGYSCSHEALKLPNAHRLDLFQSLHLIHSLKIEIAVQLDDGDELFLQCCPAELRFLIENPLAPIDDVMWWTSKDRNNIWQELHNYVSIESSNNPGESSLGLSFIYRARKNISDRIEGALSTAEALSCASDLIDYVRISLRDDYLTNREEKDIFLTNHIDFTFLGEDKEILIDETDFQKKTSTSDGSSDAQEEIDDRQQLIFTGQWEKLSDFGPNLSLSASGGLQRVTFVPGACEYGKSGLWVEDHVTSKNFTQAAAVFFRDSTISTTNTILVNMTLALDVALLFPTGIAWEAHSTYPSASSNVEADGIIPELVGEFELLVRERLLSPIDERASYTTVSFCNIPVEGFDFVPVDLPTKPIGYFRDFPERNLYGFRRRSDVTLLGVDPVLPTMVYGITKTGATSNSISVNTRNIWHNTITITEHINRYSQYTKNET